MIFCSLRFSHILMTKESLPAG